MLGWVSFYGFIDCPSKDGRNVSVPTLYPFIFRISGPGSKHVQNSCFFSVIYFYFVCYRKKHRKYVQHFGFRCRKCSEFFLKNWGVASLGQRQLWLFNFLLEADEAFEAFLVELLQAPSPIRGLSSGAPLSQSASSRPIRSLALFHKNPLTQ